jgi:predicted SAM-dependent methyltransferase
MSRRLQGDHNHASEVSMRIVTGRDERVTALLDYLSLNSVTPSWSSDPCRKIARALLPEAVLPVAHRLLTRAMRPQQRLRARILERDTPIRLNLGSGASPIRGWVNVDLVGHRPDLAWDLSVPLPLPDSSVEAIFNEHLLEHLELTHALSLLRECHRLLVTGGMLRVGVPDAGSYLRAYDSESKRFLEESRPGRPTRLLAVREVFQEHGHRSAYDFETLALMFEAAGFCAIEQRSFGDSRIEPCPDSEHRRSETLYVEGAKSRDGDESSR